VSAAALCGGRAGVSLYGMRHDYDRLSQRHCETKHRRCPSPEACIKSSLMNILSTSGHLHYHQRGVQHDCDCLPPQRHDDKLACRLRPQARRNSLMDLSQQTDMALLHHVLPPNSFSLRLNFAVFHALNWSLRSYNSAVTRGWIRWCPWICDLLLPPLGTFVNEIR
jgi:hypothetical protein